MASDSESDNNPKTYAPHDWFPDGIPVVIRLMPEYGVDVPLSVASLKYPLVAIKSTHPSG
jgi:hypothetical protein